jgi:hypothetical protein
VPCPFLGQNPWFTNKVQGDLVGKRPKVGFAAERKKGGESRRTIMNTMTISTQTYNT